MKKPMSERQEYQKLMAEAQGRPNRVVIGDGCRVRGLRTWPRALSAHEMRVIYNQEKQQ
jgi:hypothetical protein